MNSYFKIRIYEIAKSTTQSKIYFPFKPWHEQEVQENMLSLLRTADGLLRRASVDAEGIRQRLMVVDREAESFTTRLDARRKNVTMAVDFFRLAETVSGIVLLLSSLFKLL